MRCPTLKELPPPPEGKTGWPWTEESPQLPDTMPDGRPWPRISIVTPNLNYGQFIEETIRSVLLQGYPDLEYIIIDGGSTDNSIEIIKKYERWIQCYVDKNDCGQSSAIMKGMAYVTGTFVNWLNSDDFLMKNSLFKISQMINKLEDKKIIICGEAIKVDEKSKPICYCPVYYVKDKILPMSPFVEGGVQASRFISKYLWDIVGGIDKHLWATMDIDLYYRCHLAGANFVLLKEIIAAYREHNGTKTIKEWKKSIKDKKDFYYRYLNTLPYFEKRKYRKKVKRLISSYYIGVITEKDNFFLKLEKIIHSIKEDFFKVLSFYQIKRLLMILINKSKRS